MIRTLNDLISLISLIIIAFLTIRFFVGSLIGNNNEKNTRRSRIKLLADYINNEEE